MNSFTKATFSLSGGSDAKKGLYLATERIIAKLGPRPSFSPTENFTHGRATDDLRSEEELRELQADWEQTEEDRRKYGSRPLNLLGVIACSVCELLGSVSVMEDLGEAAPNNMILGSCLALFLFVITHQVFHESPQDKKAPIGRKIKAIIFILGFMALVAAISMARQLTDKVNWYEVIIMTATTIGPALIASKFITNFRNASFHRQRGRRIQRKRKSVERKASRANALVEKVAENIVAWDKNQAELKAVYDAAHARVTSRRKP